MKKKIPKEYEKLIHFANRRFLPFFSCLIMPDKMY